MNIILAIVIGLVAGGIAGFFGVSSAFVVIISISMFGLVNDQQTAAGTTLLATLPPVALLAVMSYWKRDKINVKLALLLSICILLGGGIGASFSDKIDPKLQKIMMGILFLVLSGLTFYQLRDIKSEKSALHSFQAGNSNTDLGFGTEIGTNLSGIGAWI